GTSTCSSPSATDSCCVGRSQVLNAWLFIFACSDARILSQRFMCPRSGSMLFPLFAADPPLRCISGGCPLTISTGFPQVWKNHAPVTRDGGRGGGGIEGGGGRFYATQPARP